MKLKNRIFGLLACAAFALPALVSCVDDEPDSDNYYSFTGEMMSDYIQNRPQYSEFAQLVTRAGLMDLLSSYGDYTCFLPNNDAVDAYMKEHARTIDGMTKEECDTLVRAHLVNKSYSTYDMTGNSLNTPNLNDRPIQVGFVFDADSNAVVLVNRRAHIYRTLQDDSVQNGIVQPVDRVLENSNSLLPDLISENDRVQIYYNALLLTGLADSIVKQIDENYVQPSGNLKYYGPYPTGSDTNAASAGEVAMAPETRKFRYTAFLVPDSILIKKYGVPDPEEAGMDASLRKLYEIAKDIYDKTYPEDAGQSYTEYNAQALHDRRNPLNRFMAYHLLDCAPVAGYDEYTVRDNVGVATEVIDPTDWYRTLLPYTMMKLSKLTITNSAYDYSSYGDHQTVQFGDLSVDRFGSLYINRRVDKVTNAQGSSVTGSLVLPVVETRYVNEALNGWYFYIDEIAAFSETTRDVVDNVRMRMDFSTLFPEIISNGQRMNGDYTVDNKAETRAYDFSKGMNYWYPDGYLTGVTVTGDSKFIYRHPRRHYYSYNGDEMIVQDNFDVSFRIPPVPVEGDYQIRLGFAPMNGCRTEGQIYFGSKAVPTSPQGIPLDMNIELGDDKVLGTDWSGSWYRSTSTTEAQRAEDQKNLKNKGYYRGPNSAYLGEPSSRTYFSTLPTTARIVLCTVHALPGTDYYLRIRNAAAKRRNNNECMLDYLEIVPKSVYSVNDGELEDDL